MRFRSISSAALTTAAFLLMGTHGNANDGSQYGASFSGFEEIGGLGAGETGAIFSQGQGSLSLKVDKGNRLINFQLTYSGLSSNITVSHIHFGKERVAGGVMVFFCSNLPAPPPGTQVCPVPSGTVTGTIVPANVIGPTPQNVTAGDFDALLIHGVASLVQVVHDVRLLFVFQRFRFQP
jgi:hypothetical protein